MILKSTLNPFANTAQHSHYNHCLSQITFLDTEHTIMGPTLPPPKQVKPSQSHNNDADEEPEDIFNNVHALYPTIDVKPPKTPQEKPPKKSTKSDSKYQEDPLSQSHAPHHTDHNHNNNKFDFVNYDDDITHNGGGNNQQQQGGPGPGFFNPSASKNQFPDYDPYGGQVNNKKKPNLVFNPYGQDHQNHVGGGQDNKLPPELYNILGPNAQNIRIEQLLQHIQGSDLNAGPLLHGQNIHIPFAPNQNGVNYQFGEHNNNNPLFGVPPSQLSPGHRPPPPG